MKKIFILQNSILSFGLDAKKIYQPEKYRLYLIVNDFGFNILTQRNQEKFYSKIICTNNFEFENIRTLIDEMLANDPEPYNIVTNSEETMPICGILRVHFKLDNQDYSRFYNKDTMKVLLSDNDFFDLPNYRVFNYTQYLANKNDYLVSLSKSLKYPLFAKPIAMCGSVNLKKINNFDELTAWSAGVKPDETYEIDEFIEGTMYHCDSYIKDNKVLFTFVCQNSRPCYNFTIGEMKGTIVLPSEHPDALLLSEIAEKTLHQLGTPHGGVTHLELIKTKQGKIYFIEIAHRSPGCLIPRMYQAHSDIDTITAHFLLQIDKDYMPKRITKTYAAWSCYPKQPGQVAALNNLPSNFKSACEIQWQVNIGDKIATYSQFGRDYTGTLFMTNDDFSQLYDEFIRANNLNLCKIEPKQSLSYDYRGLLSNANKFN